jgi:hypothetical protein
MAGWLLRPAPAGGLASSLAAAFTVGLAFLGDARRTDAFSAGFFLTVLVFLRVAALVAGFLRFALVLSLAFFPQWIRLLPPRHRAWSAWGRPHDPRSFSLASSGSAQARPRSRAEPLAQGLHRRATPRSLRASSRRMPLPLARLNLDAHASASAAAQALSRRCPARC